MNFVETILADYPVMAWAAVGVALIVPLRALLRRFSDRTPDINTY